MPLTLWMQPVCKLDTEELMADLLSSRINVIGNTGRVYFKPNPLKPDESYIYRIDLFDIECGGWYHSEWYDPASGDSIRAEYYEI